MENTEVTSVALIVLLVAVLWSAIPGLIAGWVLREHGRSYSKGFTLGAVCGPFGVLAALAVVFLGGGRREAPAPARTGAVRGHYAFPLVGRLHASTVWMLAGAVTFMCAWALGGLLHALYPARTSAPPSALAPAAPPAAPQQQDAEQPRLAAAGEAQPAQSSAAATGAPLQATQKNVAPAAPGSPSLTLRPAAPVSSAPTAPAAATAPPDQPPGGPTDAQGAAQAYAPPPASSRAGDAPTAPRNPPAASRPAAVSSVVQELQARGFRAHPSVSGDAGTATLTLSGETLTREAGAHLLGSRRTRDALKEAGIRIVVVINGRGSWTFML